MPSHPGDQSRGVCGLILAAGSGRRFGGAKLLAPLRGRPLLAHPVRVVADAVAEGMLSAGVVVIPEAEPALVELVLATGLTPVMNPEPGRGMASSLRIGLDRCAGQAAAMVLMGDQPLVARHHLASLLAALAEAPDAVVRPRYTGDPSVPGHPVVIPARYWSLLEGSEGDHGFGPLLGGPVPLRVVTLPGRNPDVDHAADLEALEAECAGQEERDA